MNALIAVGALIFSTLCFAQDYPSKPIRLVIPYGPGSLADAVPRLIQPGLEAALGQRLVIEHRPGAGGNIGTQQVVASPPDGYTLVMSATNNLVVNQYLFRGMTFDPLADLAPISKVVEVPLLVQVGAGSPARSLKEFIAQARANPGKLNYASPGTGTLPHLAMEIFASALGLKLVHVSYKGGAPALNALLADEVQAMLIGYATTAGPMKAGRVRALAVGSASRLAALPDVPTFAEAGYPALSREVPSNWWGVTAPKGTPAPVVERLSKEIRAALADPEVRRRYQEVGLTPLGTTPQEFAASLPAEAKAWQAVIARLGIQPN